MRRYEQLSTLIRYAKPSVILEVGTYRAQRAIAMALEALRHVPSVHYIGFDLFEAGDAHARAVELQGKTKMASERIARQKLDYLVETASKNFVDREVTFTYELHVGNTRDTLHGKRFKADFAFIDGGHSVATIAGDLAAIDAPLIVLDDYYAPDLDGACPDVEWFGCNKLVVDRPGFVLLPCADPITGGGMTYMAALITPEARKAA